jgi:hypothetical protein
MELSGPDGVQWIVYIEALPPVRRWRLLSQTVLPGRRLRLDSAEESRVSSPVPAGSPFLGERRLLAILAASMPLPAVEPPLPSPALLWRARWEALGAVTRAWWARARTLTGVGRAVVHRVLEAVSFSLLSGTSGWPRGRPPA